jgi:hypothetical protein
MIPVSVSDILKLLDQIPIWKAVSGLPKRIAEIERRLEALENQAMLKTGPQKPPLAMICPICGGTMKVTEENPHPLLGVTGLKILSMTCEACGNKTERDFDPATGYGNK